MTGSLFERKQSLTRLGSETFDLLIIGGGITGCGIARDAAARGLSVAMVEKDDIASGTSSKSSKLIHGGLRYLEQAELKLVFESVNERKRLMRLARHLVRPLPFLVANYHGDKRWLLTLDIGLWLYDALCLFQNYENHQTHGVKSLLALEPGLRREKLKGGIRYFDALTDDARLTLENAMDAKALGAAVLNHVRAESLLLEQDRVVGAKVKDNETGETVTVKAKVVINAAGPWSDEVRRLRSLDSILKPSKGVHIVVDAARLPLNNALLMNSPVDGRVVFCIPWGPDRSVVGTTDTFFEGSLDDVNPTPLDVDYLLRTANHYFPQASLQVDDVISTWSGLRPLLKPPSEAGASQVSREHLIESQPGFITIAGGKLTTYRIMAEEVVEAALEQLQRKLPSATGERPLPGALGLTESDAQLNALIEQLTQKGLPAVTSRYLVETYGNRAINVCARQQFADNPIEAPLPFQWAQVDEAVEAEFALTLDDVMSRRLQLSLRSKDQGLAVAPLVASRMGKLLNWSSVRIDRELNAYRQQIARSRQFLKRESAA